MQMKTKTNKFILSIILSEYDQEIPQSQTAENPWQKLLTKSP